MVILAKVSIFAVFHLTVVKHKLFRTKIFFKGAISPFYFNLDPPTNLSALEFSEFVINSSGIRKFFFFF